MIDFTSGNPMKQILFFSIPMLISNLLQQLYSMADTIIVGRYVGGTALAAVGSSNSLINFLVSILIGLTTGASVVISQFYGAKKGEELKKTVTTSIIFLAGVSVVITIGGVFGAGPMLRLLGVGDDIFEDAKLYLQIIMAGVTFPVYYNMYMAYMRALGDSKSPSYILAFSTTLNIVLDIIFVSTFNLGIAGAAIATITSQSLALLLSILVANRNTRELKFDKLVLDKKIFKLILEYGIPSSIQFSITGLASLSIMRLVNSFGAISTAGYSAGIRVENFAMIPLSNISQAISTFVGQNMGAGLEDRAHHGLKSGIQLVLIISVVTSAILLVFNKTLMGLFVNEHDINAIAIINEGTVYLSVISMFYLLFGIFFAYNGFFRGAGDAVIVMILTITSLSIRAICAYVFSGVFGMGLEAVAWSIPIGWGICGFIAFVYYKAGKWKGKVAVNKVSTE